jgi:3-oxoacyl-[acyl-carrier protein] reductase
MNKLGNKVAIVTGSARGVGSGIARRLAAEGARVVVNYLRDEKSAADVVTAIVAAGGNAVAVQADVADETQVHRLFERAQAEYGRLDILVNNAGILRYGPIEGLERATFLQLIDVNLWSMMAASREAARRFGSAGGRIINISSSVARQGLGYYAAYAASKAAVEAATRCLAVELAPRKILVNAIAPAAVDTDMIAEFGPEAKQMIIGITPLGRLGQPDDFGGVAAFLASDDSAWITGQVIPVNGGYVM